MKLFWALGLGLLWVLLFPGGAQAASCKFNTKAIPMSLQKKAQALESLSGPVDRARNADEAPVLSQKLTRKMLRASWKAFGYRGRVLGLRVSLNMKQIHFDSQRKPHLDGAFPGSSALPYYRDSEGVLLGGPPGGLFAFFIEDYREWKDRGSWRGSPSKFNPLSNIIASVSAQVQSGIVFDGQARIILPAKNSC